MREVVRSLSERMTRMEEIEINWQGTNEEFSGAYDRGEQNIRHRRSTSPDFLSLKETRAMIPEFDGSSRYKLQEFLNACTFAIQNINPAKEEASSVHFLYKTEGQGNARI